MRCAAVFVIKIKICQGKDGSREREREQLLQIQLETIRSRFGFVPCLRPLGSEDSEVSGHIAIGAIGKAPTHICNAVAQGVHGPGTRADGHLVIPWLFRSQRCWSILMAPGRTESKRRFENTRKKKHFMAVLWLYYGCIMAVILGIPLSAHKQQKEMRFLAGCSPNIVARMIWKLEAFQNEKEAS